MSSVLLAFNSERAVPSHRAVSSLRAGEFGVITEIRAHVDDRADRLLALGVTPGATVTVLQTFPGIVLLCDQTELALERRVAEAILVRPQESRS
jgi:Fe2+ transport system protein FeoA